MNHSFPVAIIGTGPIGLAAPDHLVERDLPFVVFEAGPRVGHSALAWGHELFSPWQYCIDPAATRLLQTTGWQLPDPESYPTGRALVEQYLAPLAAHPAIAPHIRLNQRVVAVTRAGFDKMKTVGRAQVPETSVTWMVRRGEIGQAHGGGPAPAGADACCVKDADAQAAGQDGRGCGATEATPIELVAGAGGCCG